MICSIFNYKIMYVLVSKPSWWLNLIILSPYTIASKYFCCNPSQTWEEYIYVIFCSNMFFVMENIESS